MHSTGYIVRFVLILTSLVALILALMSTFLKPIHEKNEAIYNKRAIISAVQSSLDKPVAQMSDAEVQGIFDQNIKQIVVDYKGNVVDEAGIKSKGYAKTKAENIEMRKEKKKADEDRLWPVLIFEKGDVKNYILAVRGNGLWDEIWANIALDKDLNTIVGTAFDHVGETPGLGAEIKDNGKFPLSFVGKKLYTGDDYKSVAVKKGGSKDQFHGVDAITGATVTCDGVTDMMYDGLKYYEPYLKKLKNK